MVGGEQAKLPHHVQRLIQKKPPYLLDGVAFVHLSITAKISIFMNSKKENYGARLLVAYETLLHASQMAIEMAQEKFKHDARRKIGIIRANLDKFVAMQKRSKLGLSQEELEAHRELSDRFERIGGKMLTINVVLSMSPDEVIERVSQQLTSTLETEFTTFRSITPHDIELKGYKMLEATDEKWEFEGDDLLGNDPAHKLTYFVQTKRMHMRYKPSVINEAILPLLYNIDASCPDHSTFSYLFSAVRNHSTYQQQA
jgi:hypothetical protein